MSLTLGDSTISGGSESSNIDLQSITTTGVSIVAPRSGDILNTYGIKAGNGLSVLANSTDVIISATTQPGLFYKGQWDASSNSPVLSTPETSGNYYIVGVQGTTTLSGISEWDVSDWLVSNGTVWQKLNNSSVLDPTIITNLQPYQGFTRNAGGTAFVNTPVVQNVVGVGVQNSLIANNTAGVVSVKGIGVGTALTASATADTIMLNVPKITSNSVQISDSGTGWTVKDATGSISFQSNNVPKFLIPSNANFSSGFPAGANTACMIIPSGTTAQRSNSTAGIRFNTTDGRFECYNGSSWVHLILPPVVSSVGTGTAVLKTATSSSTVLRSITGTGATVVSLVGDDIQVFSTAGASTMDELTDVDLSSLAANNVLRYDIGVGQFIPSSIVTSSVGAGTSVVKFSGQGSNTVLRSLVAGTNITLDGTNPDSITINSSGGGGSVQSASNVGSGTGVYKEQIGTDLRFKSLVPGSNVSLTTVDPNTITINSTSTPTTISIQPDSQWLTATLTGSNYVIGARGSDSIRIGVGSAPSGSNNGGLSVGDSCALGTGFERCVLGPSSQGGGTVFNRSCAFGIQSGFSNQGERSLCFGYQTCFSNAGASSVSIGDRCGYSGTAAYSIQCGFEANFSGPTNVPSVVLNAGNVSLNSLAGGGCYITPILEKTSSDRLLKYNPTTKELTTVKDFQSLKVCTTAERNFLSGLVVGSVVFNSDLLTIDVWGGSVWRSI